METKDTIVWYSLYTFPLPSGRMIILQQLAFTQITQKISLTEQEGYRGLHSCITTVDIATCPFLHMQRGDRLHTKVPRSWPSQSYHCCCRSSGLQSASSSPQVPPAWPTPRRPAWHPWIHMTVFSVSVTEPWNLAFLISCCYLYGIKLMI